MSPRKQQPEEPAEEMYPEGGTEEQESFEIGDELPTDEAGDPDLDAILNQANADYTGEGDEDEITIDWNPEKSLIPEGDWPAVLVSVKPDKTNPQDNSQPKPTLRWKVKITDEEWPFERDKNIPLSGGKGIERLNVEIAQAFGVEVGQNEDGTMRLSLRELREKAVGQPCIATIEHNAGRKDKDRMFDNLKTIKPYVGETLEGIG